jgi:hypothetical protein
MFVSPFLTLPPSTQHMLPPSPVLLPAQARLGLLIHVSSDVQVARAVQLTLCVCVWGGGGNEDNRRSHQVLFATA